jgi:hypothetical protein
MLIALPLDKSRSSNLTSFTTALVFTGWALAGSLSLTTRSAVLPSGM